MFYGFCRRKELCEPYRQLALRLDIPLEHLNRGGDGFDRERIAAHDCAALGDEARVIRRAQQHDGDLLAGGERGPGGLKFDAAFLDRLN